MDMIYFSSSLTWSSNLTDLFNAASTKDATCFFMDDLDFLGTSFLAFLDPALEVLGLLALHSFSSSFSSFVRFLYSPVLYSLWSKLIATLLSTLKISLGEFENRKKSTQALSVYRKGTFCVYIKCLIVASSKVTIKRRSRKKGHFLSYRFERYMEFGDASDEEAPPEHPNKKDLTKSLRMQIVSMLQGMENDGSLPRGSITAIAKRFDVARCTVHRIWKRAARTRAMGLINSPDFNSRKKNSGRPPIYPTEFVREGVKDVPLKK